MNTLTIYVKGGAVVEVEGLPDEYHYEVIDEDEPRPHEFGCAICGEAFCQDSHTSVNKHGW